MVDLRGCGLAGEYQYTGGCQWGSSQVKGGHVRPLLEAYEAAATADAEAEAAEAAAEAELDALDEEEAMPAV